MMNRWLGLGVLALSGCMAAPNYAKNGDQAVAVGNWRAAVENYSRALSTSPNSPELQAKYQSARSQAIAQSLSIAKRCQSENNPACVEAETSYVLGLDPVNADAAAMQSATRTIQATSAIATAKNFAARADFLSFVRTLRQARSMSTDPSISAAADAAAREIAPAAFAFVQARLDQPPPPDVSLQAQIYGEGLEVANDLAPFAPDRMSLIAAVRTRYESAAAQVDQQRQALVAADAEAQRQRLAAEESARAQAAADEERRRADDAAAIRVVSLLQVLLAPGKADGRPWDGFGDPTALLKAAKDVALTTGQPHAILATQVAAILGGPTAAALDPPDPTGAFEAFSRGNLRARIILEKRPNTLTPQWSNARIANVDIRSDRLRVVLRDEDLTKEGADDIGIIEIGPDDMKAALAAGTSTPLRVIDRGNGQVLFLYISVM